MTAITEGSSVRTLVELMTDDGTRVPAGTRAHVTATLNDGEAFDLEVTSGDYFDEITATADQVEPV